MSAIQTQLSTEVSKLSGDFATQLSNAFVVMAAKSDEWLEKARSIVVESEADTDGMKQARASRLELRQIRIKAENARKEMKAGYLAGGRAVDAVANVIKNAIEPVEEVLLAKEEFVERKAAKEKAARTVARRGELLAMNVVPALYENQAAEFTDEQWAAFVQGQKDAIEAFKKREADEAAAREAERLRVAALDAENKRLREEKEAADKAHRLALFRAQQEAQAAKAKADAEAARIAAENERVINEERRIAEDARRELARVEFEKAQQAKREAMAKEAAEIAAKHERNAALKAPDIEKLKAYMSALIDIPTPHMTTPEGSRVLQVIINGMLQINSQVEGMLK